MPVGNKTINTAYPSGTSDKFENKIVQSFRYVRTLLDSSEMENACYYCYL